MDQCLAFQEENYAGDQQDHQWQEMTGEICQQFFYSGDCYFLCMSYNCLFSGQQHEDVWTRCKILAGRNSTWTGDTPRQNMEETHSSQNIHFIYASSQHTCPIILRLWWN